MMFISIALFYFALFFALFYLFLSSVFSKSEFYSAKEPKCDMEKKIYIKHIIRSVFPPKLY